VGEVLPGVFKIKFVIGFLAEKKNKYRTPRTYRKGLSEVAVLIYGGFNLQAVPAPWPTSAPQTEGRGDAPPAHQTNAHRDYKHQTYC
jgi:hypothetical protein